MMAQCLLQLCAHFGSVFRQLREIVCARVAQGGAAIRAGCAHSSGSVGQWMDPLSLERRGAVLWTDPPASVWTSAAHCCYLRAGCCRTVCMGWWKTSGKVHSSFEIHSEWSVCTGVRTVLRKDAHKCTRLSISVATRMHI
jgi:hypothetical protein